MKLTDTQSIVLSAAAARADGAILPLPSHLRGGAVAKVCEALKAKGLAVAIGGDERKKLIISDGGRQALGLPIGLPPVAEPPSITAPGEGRKPRTDTKQAQLIAMLGKPEGASVDEIVSAFGWQAHTVRGAIAGALKKKLGLQVGSEAIEGRGRVYRIAE